MAYGPVTRPRAVWWTLRDDIWRDKDTKDRHPADTSQHHIFRWITSYFLQIVELLCPTAFFPVDYALPLDQWDEERRYPNINLMGRAHLTEPWKLHPNLEGTITEGMSAEDTVKWMFAWKFEHDVWQQTMKDGLTVRQKYNFALANQRPEDEKVTIWQEINGSQVTTRPMRTGAFIVGGTLGPALGLETQPHFVSHVRVFWLGDGGVRVIWQTESTTLESRWAISEPWIMSGVGDAGLAEGFVSLRQSWKKWEIQIYALPYVSSTWNSGTNAGLMPWKSQIDVLPCIEEPWKWSLQAEQWRRRAMLGVESRAVHERQSWITIPFRRSKVSKIPFHGVGLFITGTQAGKLTGVIPKPTLSVPLLELPEQVTQVPLEHGEDYCIQINRVQESIMEKWHSRVKPSTVPTHLCNLRDDFKLVEAMVGTEYVAISHRWGEFEDATLRSAIQEVANELDVQYAWVDTWCIPPDPERKAFEISRMGDYYSEASAVIVMLLGVESRTTYTDLKHGVPFDLHKARAKDAALAHEISHSEWKSRVWTIQEGLLAQNCIVKTKDQILDGEYLDHLLHLPDHCRRNRWAALGNTYSQGSPLVNTRGIWSSHGFTVYGCTFGNRPWWSNGHESSVVDVPNKTGLVEALKLGRGRRCAQKVDYVIGLLGLVQGRIPPLAAGRDNWQSIWRKLVQNGVAGPDVLSSERVCDDMCWAPAAIDGSNPLKNVAISGETAPQELSLTNDGVEISGTPLKVIVGDDASKVGIDKPLHNEKFVTLVMAGGEELRTFAQVPTRTGTTCAGVALPDQALDKGVLVLLGEWTNKDGEPLVFRRHTCMNAVRSLKLSQAIQKPQRVLISDN